MDKKKRGRPSNEIIGTGPVPSLARQLRALREDRELRLDDLVTKTGLSIATLSRAEGGEKLPTQKTYDAIVLACGEDPAEWSTRWTAAHMSLRNVEAPAQPDLSQGRDRRPIHKGSPDGRGFGFNPPPFPGHSRTIAEFKTCVRQAKIWADDPPVRTLASAMGTPTTTVQDFLTDNNSLGDIQVLRHFLDAIGIKDGFLAEWEYAWRNLNFRDTEKRRRAADTAAPLRKALRQLYDAMYSEPDIEDTPIERWAQGYPAPSSLSKASHQPLKALLIYTDSVLRSADWLVSHYGYPKSAESLYEAKVLSAIDELRETYRVAAGR